MRFTSAAGMVGDGRLPAYLAICVDGGHFGRVVRLQHMFVANVIRLEDRNEWRWRGRLFDVGPASGFLSFDETHNADHHEPKIPRRFDRLNRRSTGGADVVNDHHAHALFSKPLNALTRSMLLFSFTHEKTIQFATRNGNSHHDRVRTHREPADCLRLPSALVDFIEKDLPGKLRSTGIERGQAAIDVVVAGSAGGKLELPQLERLVGEKAKEFLARGR